MVRAIEWLRADFEAIFPYDHRPVPVSFPVHIVPEINAPDIEIKELLIGGILVGDHLPGSNSLAAHKVVPLETAGEVFQAIAIAHLREIIHGELTTQIKISVFTP